MLTADSLRAALDDGYMPATEFAARENVPIGSIYLLARCGLPSRSVGGLRMIHSYAGRWWLAENRRPVGRPRKTPAPQPVA